MQKIAQFFKFKINAKQNSKKKTLWWSCYRFEEWSEIIAPLISSLCRLREDREKYSKNSRNYLGSISPGQEGYITSEVCCTGGGN